jgi:amino acid permease
MFQAARRYLPTQASLQAARQASINAAREASLIGAGVRERTVNKGKALLQESQLHLKDIELPRFEPPDTSLYALLGTTFNLLNATTGPGLLALPLAFARCGWLLGTVLLCMVFALNHMALKYLLKACLTTREHSYIGLSLRHSPEIAALVDWASCAFFAGSCVSYLVIIGDTFSGFTARLGQGPWFVGGEWMHYSGFGLVALVLFVGLCLAPLSTLRSMDSLQCTSAVAMVCILYAVAIVVIAPGASADPSVMDADQGGPRPQSALASASSLIDDEDDDRPVGPMPFVLSSQTLLSLPTMAFCFASQPLFPPALETLHQPATYGHMNTVVNVTMGLTLVLHLLVALGGYLRFGATVTPNVLAMLPQGPLVAAAQLAIVVAFAFTYPMMIFLCRMHIQSTIARATLGRQQTDDSSAHGGGADAAANDHHMAISLLLVGACALPAPRAD